MAKNTSKEIAPVWIVTDMETLPICDDAGHAIEHRTERAAVKAGKEHVRTSQDDEAWVFKLSHVVCRPDGEPTVDVVK